MDMYGLYGYLWMSEEHQTATSQRCELAVPAPLHTTARAHLLQPESQKQEIQTERARDHCRSVGFVEDSKIF